MKKNELIPIAKNLGIKYLTWMTKKEMIEEILKADRDETPYKNRYMCEHGKQKYKCVLCEGKHICEHKKQRPACKLCKK